MLISNFTVLEPSNFHCLPERCLNEILPDNSSFMCSHSLDIADSLAQKNSSADECSLFPAESSVPCNSEVNL